MVSSIQVQIRQGAFHDSVVLMQLQKALIALPGVLDAGVVMGTEANKQVLRQSDLLTEEARAARAEDLIVSVRAETDATARAALDQVDALLTRRAAATASEYRPRSLESAISMLPQAQWVIVSVPGRYAASVARDALRLRRHIFLYSDNVPLEQEIELKQTAREYGLLVMGPDCGTAIINGISLGFANRVRRGRIGMVGASGTGVQAVSARIHNLGAGVSHAIGTGTHDLSADVGAITARQALEVLRQDSATDVIVLISKPPSPPVAARVLDAARKIAKPVVVDFIGYAPANERDGNLHFARTLSDAAEIATKLVPHSSSDVPPKDARRWNTEELGGLFGRGQRYLRGLYAGGTLAYEAQWLLRDFLDAVYSNAPLISNYQLPSPTSSQSHTILDLGADEFTVGRLHPMLDNDLRIRRLKQEADDAQVAIILLDVVLGYGAHPDPASELAPAIAAARDHARRAGRNIEIVAVVIGTDEDPQGYSSQMQRLTDAGARVETDHAAAVRYAGALARRLDQDAQTRANAGSVQARPEPASLIDSSIPLTAPNSAAFQTPFAAINVGLESFYESLKQQSVPSIHVDWRPPAGGNEKLMAILESLKSKT